MAGYSWISVAGHPSNFFKIVKKESSASASVTQGNQPLYYLETYQNANPQATPPLNQKLSE